MSTPNLFPWIAIAVCAHGAALAASEKPAPAKSWPGPPLEVELAASADPESPPPPSVAPPLDEKPPSEPVSVARMPGKSGPRSIAMAPRAATAAKVGTLLTSGETADSADPVAFFSDPNGGVYGSGVVARGGQADHGVGSALAAPAAVSSRARGDVDGITPAANLGRSPSLEEADACRGFFPTEAAVDNAKVDLVVVVEAGGRVASATVARESPEGEGFGQAARACLLSKRFTPGADRGGRAVTAATAVRVHFMR